LSTIYNVGVPATRPWFSRLNRLRGLPAVLGRRTGRVRSQPTTELHNYRMMRGDSVAMGIITSVVPFLPVFIVRLGGSEFEVSLLTAIPAVSGFLLAIPLGQFLQGKLRIVPWYSGSRLIAHLSYAVAAVVVLLAPRQVVVPALLVVWAIAAIPSTLGMVAFPIVMDGAAGPRGRYEIMGRRWAIMGLTTAITVAIVGQLLDSLPFPANYQIVFVGFSVAGLVSFRFSSRFRVPEHPARPHESAGRRLDRLRESVRTVRSEPAFLRYSARQLVYVVGTRFALPLIPLYYVREVGAPDAWIGIIATGQALALLIGYQLWRKVSVKRGGTLVLLVTLFVNALYPAALSLVDQLILVAGLTALAAVFSAGVDLALFDELMKRIPRPYGVTFTSVDTALVNGASILAPLLGAAIAIALGLPVALQLASVIGLLGVILFASDSRNSRLAEARPDEVAAPV
jgi:MFS family permease